MHISLVLSIGDPGAHVHLRHVEVSHRVVLVKILVGHDRRNTSRLLVRRAYPHGLVLTQAKIRHVDGFIELHPCVALLLHDIRVTVGGVTFVQLGCDVLELLLYDLGNFAVATEGDLLSEEFLSFLSLLKGFDNAFLRNIGEGKF